MARSKDPECFCRKGLIHSVATDDIKAGDSVMTMKDGYGESLRWVTQKAPFQIHEKDDNIEKAMAHD